MRDTPRPPIQTPSVSADWNLLPNERLPEDLALNQGHECQSSTEIGGHRTAAPSFGDGVGSSREAFVAVPVDLKEQAQAQQLKDRLQLLKIRSAAVGACGVVGLGAGIWMLGNYGPALVDACLSLWSSSKDVHIPSSLFTERNDDKDRTAVVLQLTFLVVGLMGVSFVSRGRLEGINRILWKGLLVLISACLLYLNLGDWRGRNALESALAQHDWVQSSRLLSEFPANLPRQYVLAQVAHAAADASQISSIVPQMLRDLDLIVEQVQLPRAEGGAQAAAQLRLLRGLDAKVIYELDVAVNHHPRSEVAVAYSQGHIPSHRHEGMVAVRLAVVVMVSLGILVFAIASLVLWLRMEARVRRVTPWADSPHTS